jgi:hypothetical protein
LLSMNGPSVSSVRPCSRRTVVADSTCFRRTQPATSGRASAAAIRASIGRSASSSITSSVRL